MKFRTLAMTTVAGALALSSNTWAAVVEQEANNPIQLSQHLTVTSDLIGIVGVLGAVGSTRIDDLDFYTFQGKAGDVVTLDIDNGMGGNGQQSVDTILAVFDSNYNVLRMNDDNTLDDGSASVADSRIDNFTLPADGEYIVGVSSYPRYFQNGGGVYYANYISDGDYDLEISGVSPSLAQINIEVKPGNRDDWAPVNPKSHGKVPVALLGSSSFDAMDVKVSTLTFGATGNEASLSHCNKTGVDVNGDGVPDMVCHFYNQKAGFSKDSLEGVVRGMTKKGVSFEGRSFLKVVPGVKE